MIEPLRRHTSLLIAVLVVIAVGASGVMAQGPAGSASDDDYQVAASGNAAKVDGLDAVKAGATKKKRAGKLVATNKKGLLPANIVRPFWWAIAAKPAAFADGQIAWGEVVGIPAGFADGTDNVGYSSATSAPIGIGAGGSATDLLWVYADTPPGSDVELTIIPAVGASLRIEEEWWTQGPRATVPPVPAGMLRHWYRVRNYPTDPATTFKVRTRVFNTGIAPAALKKSPNKIKVGVSKKGPKGKKKRR